SRKYGMESSAIAKVDCSLQSIGDDGLKRSRSRKIYSFKEKLSVVQSYLTSEFSYQELALQVGINNPTMIARWVNEFKIAGPDALRPHKKGRKRTLSESRTSKPDTQGQKPVVDTSVEHVQELEDENLKLRIENAFLKELRRLRLEDEAKTRGFQKSSAVSENHSN
ncbi:helix-turn-helix domain-containing protein, partial [Megasphaera sp. NM10]|uniref:helix-turn-helix domain-containing protein n=1 Tax=Megasphaera sp. NM10 TaxID=1273103 RepID=UPI00035786A4